MDKREDCVDRGGSPEDKSRRVKGAIIDDDMAMETLADALRYRGYDASRVRSATQALQAIDELAACDIIILDIIMSWPAGLPKRKLGGDHCAGMDVFLQLRERRKELPIIVHLATQDESIVSAIKSDSNSVFLSKWNEHTIQDLAARIEQMLHLETPVVETKIFIVHGQDETAKLQLKNYLQNSLNFSEPTILHEQPNRG